MPSPNVKVFTAGDHFAGDERPGDTKELLEMLLNRAGYTKEYDWECRVDKLKHCSGESRPVRVVGFKSYGIMLRVKPTVNATVDYQMTLYIPQGSGYSAKNLFEQLKANEKSISRVIRQQKREEKLCEPKEKVVIPPAPSPFSPKVKEVQENTTNGTIIAVEEYRPEFKTLQRIINNVDKLRYVLSRIEVVNNFNFCSNRVQFVETLKHECKWGEGNDNREKGHNLGAIGRVLTELVKNEYLMGKINDLDKIIGYELTEKGNSFITKHKDYKPLPPPQKEESKVDISDLLINIREKLQELADVANKLNNNNIQKMELLQKVEQLDKENAELSKVLCQNKECQDVLSKLGKFVTLLPVQGMKQ